MLHGSHKLSPPELGREAEAGGEVRDIQEEFDVSLADRERHGANRKTHGRLGARIVTELVDARIEPRGIARSTADSTSTPSSTIAARQRTTQSPVETHETH